MVSDSAKYRKLMKSLKDKGISVDPATHTIVDPPQPPAEMTAANEPVKKEPVAKKPRSEASHAPHSGLNASHTDEALAQALAIHDKKEGKEDKEIIALIERTFKTEGWRVIKFQNGPNERKKATRMVLKLLDLPRYDVENPADADRVSQWVRAYEGHVCKAINKLRNYTQGQLMDHGGYYWIRTDGGGNLPSMDDLQRLNVRDLDPENDDDCALWKWWQTKVVVKAAGHQAGWDPNKHLHLTMSKGTLANAPRKLYIPPSTEGVAQTFIANNYVK